MMTSAHAIERAEHALRTGQPNLAMTYMRRARVLIQQEKQARYFGKLDRAVARIDAVMDDVAQAMADLVARITDNLARVPR